MDVEGGQRYSPGPCWHFRLSLGLSMKIRLLALLSLSALMVGCSTHSSNLQVGNEQSYTSLRDQREAVRTVKVYEELPVGAEFLTEVSAGRCHRSFVEEAPDESAILTDLKIAAYAQGADGITDVKVSKASGLNRNCWYVLGGTAKAFAVPAE